MATAGRHARIPLSVAHAVLLFLYRTARVIKFLVWHSVKCTYTDYYSQQEYDPGVL